MRGSRTERIEGQEEDREKWEAGGGQGEVRTERSEGQEDREK